ncbi:MAG: hypothetical protein AUK26_00865 [Syntrophaceae bacterium CG2_30_58_14]|nr:MAG: hypothetical protein AUK26_00865 [Syntrophaceae bacterium CG2_30_58_14]
MANKWMRTNYGAPLRKWLREQGLELVVDFGALPIFPEATAYPCIVRLRKGSKRKSFTACNVKRLADLDLEALVRTEGTEVAFSLHADRFRLDADGRRRTAASGKAPEDGNAAR